MMQAKAEFAQSYMAHDRYSFVCNANVFKLIKVFGPLELVCLLVKGSTTSDAILPNGVVAGGAGGKVD